MKPIEKRTSILIGLFVLILSITTGCMVDEMNLQKLTDFYNDSANGLVQTSEYDPVKFEMTYKPTTVLALRECCAKGEFNPDAYTASQSLIEQYMYFSFSLSAQDSEIEAFAVNGKSEFGKRIADLSFGLGQHMIAVSATNDTIMLSDFSYSRTYGATKNTSFLLAFDRKSLEPGKSFRIIFQDYILKTGITEFKFKCEDIQNVERIKLKI